MKRLDLDGCSLEEIYHIYNKINCKNEKVLLLGIASSVASSFNPIFLLGVVGVNGYMISALKQNISFITKFSSYYRNSKEYLELYEYYQIFLEELSKLVSDLGWDNEMKIFSGYTYLLKKGYLSSEHQFYFYNHWNEPKDLLGTDIMLGSGCCRNISSLLTDLLNINGYFACDVSMLLDKDIVTLSNLDLFKTDEINGLTGENDEIHLEKSILFKLVSFIINLRDFYNHRATLFVDDNHSYVMDALNDAIYGIDDDLKCFQGENIFDISYDAFANRGEKIKLKRVLKPTSSLVMESRLSDYYKVLEMCLELTDVFEKFYSEHKELYGEIIEKRRILIREYDKYNILSNKK